MVQFATVSQHALEFTLFSANIKILSKIFPHIKQTLICNVKMQLNSLMDCCRFHQLFQGFHIT